MSLTKPKNAAQVGPDAYMWQLTQLEVVENWEELADMFQPVVLVSRGELSTFSLLHSCAHERAYCFIGAYQGTPRVALVASLHEYPEHKICLIDAYAGRASLFYQYLRYLELWAQMNGCDFMEGHGTAGAQRLAKRHGFQHSHMVYRKPL